MDRLKSGLLIIIIILLIILIYKITKQENLDSTSSTNFATEAVQNIASVYAESSSTVNFNNLNAQNFRGIIVAWSGTVANIPNGWGLCDGTNGTPDLRGRFLRMLSKPGNANNAGYYSEPVSLPGVDPKAKASQGSGNGSSIDGLEKLSQIVGGLQIGSTGGTDAYQLQIAEMPTHSHGNLGVTNYGGGDFTGGARMGDFGTWTANPAFNTGGSSGHPSTPPYYVVAYIMKL